MQLCSLRMSEGQVQGDNISDAGSYVSGTADSDAGSFVEKEGSELLDALDIDNYSDSSDGREEEDSSSSVPRSTSPVPEASKPTLTSPKLSNGVYSNDEHLRARLETELAKEKEKAVEWEKRYKAQEVEIERLGKENSMLTHSVKVAARSIENFTEKLQAEHVKNEKVTRQARDVEERNAQLRQKMKSMSREHEEQVRPD